MSTIGFPDFRRQIDYDTTAPLAVFTGNAVPNGTTLGPYNLGNFAAISGFIGDVTAPYLLNFTFYADVALTQTLGVRFVRFDPAGAGGGQFRITALGRWVTLTITTLGAVAAHPVGVLQGSNRPTGTELIPNTPILITNAVAGIGAGATVTTYALTSASGRATVTLATGGQPWLLSVEALSLGFGYSTIAYLRLGAGGSQSVDVTLPLSQVRITVTNTGGAADGAYYALVADTSGG